MAVLPQCAVALAALAGCDQVFGLDPIHVLDAMPDAQRVCPAPGTHVAPVFSSSVQTIVSTCDHYVISRASGTAMAGCAAAGSRTVIEQGAIEGALTDAMLPTVANADLQQPRLVPEGDEVVVRRYDVTDASKIFFDDYTRTGGGPWTLVGDIPFPVTPAARQDEISVPSLGPVRRLIYTSFNATSSTFVELAGSSTTWSPTGMSYSAPQLGMTALRHANLTADALHLLVIGTASGGGSGLYISDRMDPSQPFGTAVPVSSILGNVTDAYMTEDCALLYFAVGNMYGVFRANQ